MSSILSFVMATIYCLPSAISVSVRGGSGAVLVIWRGS